MNSLRTRAAFQFNRCPIGQSSWLRRFQGIFVLTLWFLNNGLGMAETNVKIIAHRGASGYCQEHSEAAKALAHAQKADYIEQDVVLSRDQVFVVSHDLTLNATTNVEDVYPDRSRPDKKHYVADFTWEELCRLQLCHRSERGGDKTKESMICGQRLMRLDNEIAFLKQLDQAFARRTGLYIELKGASFHLKEFGARMGDKLVALLRDKGVPFDPESCLIQCFEPDELVHLSEQNCPYKLIQLLGGDRSEVDFERIAKYAYGLGPSLNQLAVRDAEQIKSSGFVEKARAAGLFVHPYTVRRDYQPKWSKSLDETHRFLIDSLRVDGFFTDYPDLGKQATDH